MIAIKLLVQHHVGKPDLWCPVFTCDTCGRYISDPKMGMVSWDNPALSSSPLGSGHQIGARVTHKGACNKSGLFASWSELTVIAAQLAYSVKDPVTEWEAAA